MSEHPADASDDGPGETRGAGSGSSAARRARSGSSAARRARSGSSAARGAWMASGLAFFVTGVAFTVAMPDNIVMGITFLGLGVVLFSLAGTQRAPGDGPEGAADTPSQTMPPGDAPPPPRG